ncbi:MAG TPA: acylphosphatase [Patescibacteria group bacterium]|nr:acylphosphatase [Patescibacteria group bacterium]
MKVVHLLIFGKVHGVGFRSYVKHNARKLGLVGWVRNLPEGTVEAEVSGSEKAVDQLVQLSKKGPFLAEVTSVDVTDMEKDFPYSEFLLRHDVE